MNIATDMHRIIRTITITLASLLLCTACQAKKEETGDALTTLLQSYEGKKGVEYMDLKGMSLKFAKPSLKKTPMKNVVDDIEHVSIFFISNASADTAKQFTKKLTEALKGYEMVGTTKEDKKESTIYLIREDDALISEMVVYTTEEKDIALIIMKGEFPVSALEEMAAQQSNK